MFRMSPEACFTVIRQTKSRSHLFAKKFPYMKVGGVTYEENGVRITHFPTVQDRHERRQIRFFSLGKASWIKHLPRHRVRQWSIIASRTLSIQGSQFVNEGY